MFIAPCKNAASDLNTAFGIFNKTPNAFYAFPLGVFVSNHVFKRKPEKALYQN